MKQRGLKCQFQKCEKKLWPHSQTTPTDIVAHLRVEFIVMSQEKGATMSLLSLKVLVKFYLERIPLKNSMC